MKYKLLAFDLDGTLVNKANKISNKNMQALVEYIDVGGIVCFITGRSINSALNIADYIYKKTNTKIHYICALNGSYIYDYKNDKTLILNPIKDETYLRIKEILDANNVAYAIYSQKALDLNQIWVYNCPLFFKMFLYTNKHNKIVYKKNTDIASDIYKINVVRLISKKKFGNIIKILEQDDDIAISKTSTYMIEITKKDIHKGYALKYICQHLNIDLNHTLVIGDSGNDIPMFEIAGKSIAINLKKLNKHNIKPSKTLNCSINEIAYIVIKYELK